MNTLETFILPIKEAKERFRFIKRGELEKKIRMEKEKLGTEEIERRAYQVGVARAEYNRGWEESVERANARWAERHGG